MRGYYQGWIQDSGFGGGAPLGSLGGIEYPSGEGGRGLPPRNFLKYVM